ncbi:tripartite tricarboxylate transporter substrate-binding protein [Elongatibacter sediminis]|uniref:Tripartite tricarboxylate transporter substrate-binding protein n=1 Tax=Elongatibacter sediminis TaxID=3119006 RepID=A0AAW9RCB4_9GAMM
MAFDGRGRVAGIVFAVCALVMADEAGATPCEMLADQTLRWVVPSKPGGGYDAYSRLIQPYLEQRLGARILIDNRPQAGGIVGAAAIRDARPDGRTLGFINAPGLLAAHVSGRQQAPDPSTDFTLLARVVSNRMLLFTGHDSGIGDAAELLRVAADRPVVAGTRDAGSASFFVFPIVAHHLGLDYAMVTGYVGSTARVHAAVRGEVDVIVQTLDSVMPYVVTGELRPLLWVSGAPADGSSGPLAVRVPGLSDFSSRLGEGNEGDGVADVAAAVSSILLAGRTIVAPAGLPEAEAACLERAVMDVLKDPLLQQRAEASGLTLEPVGAEQAGRELREARRHMRTYAFLVRSVIDRTSR